MKPRHAASLSDSRRKSSDKVAHVSWKDVGNGKQKRKVATFEWQHSEAMQAAGASLAAKKQNKPKTQHATQRQDAVVPNQDSVNSRHHNVVLASKAASSTSGWEAKSTKIETLKLTPMGIKTDCAVADGLHEEIMAYSAYTKKTVDKMAVHIEQIIVNVRTSVQAIWPQAKVETFGSYSTGIWLPSSDVDLVILDVVEVNDSIVIADHLRELSKVLETKEWVDSVLCLDTAKMPVLKLVSAETSVPIDITFESAATHSGLLARDLIKRYVDTMPELYPLAIVIKQLLRERDLNDAYTGGLSSYSVVLMIIHFSQLWRHGELCFEAASIYASGSLPPAPSKMKACKAAQTRANISSLSGKSKSGNDSAINESKAQQPKTSTVDTHKKSALLPAPTYAAVVKQRAAIDSKRNTLSEPRLSYAAVAAGVAKVSPLYKPVNPPSSYAAAVSAPVTPVPSTEKYSNANAQKKHTQLDSISVSSSNADTEDSSSSCSHSSLADSDDEVQPQQKPILSLGQHLMMILEFFGIIFDYHKNGISVRDGGYIYRLAATHCPHIGKPALVIEDPIHPDRNVSASSFAFPKVVALFEDSYYALKYFRTSKYTPSALRCLLTTSDHMSHTSHDRGHSARS